MLRFDFLRGLVAVPIAAVIPNAQPREEPDTPGQDGTSSRAASAPPEGAIRPVEFLGFPWPDAPARIDLLRRERRMRAVRVTSHQCIDHPDILDGQGFPVADPIAYCLPEDAVLIHECYEHRYDAWWMAWGHESFQASASGYELPNHGWLYRREEMYRRTRESDSVSVKLAGGFARMTDAADAVAQAFRRFPIR